MNKIVFMGGWMALLDKMEEGGDCRNISRWKRKLLSAENVNAMTILLSHRAPIPLSPRA